MAISKDIKPMADADVQRIVHGMLDDATSFVDDELGPEREKATLYYLGKPFAWDKDLKGRSKVIVTEVRDGVNGILPSILEVFFGPEQVVEYQPTNAEKEPYAQQATAYISQMFQRNGGFMESFSVIKDGLVRKLGIYKWGWVDRERSAHKLYDVSEEQMVLLTEDPNVTVTKVEEYEDGGNCVHYLHVDNEGYPFFEAVPPNEFLLTRDTRNRKTAPMLGHRTEVTTDFLLSLGVSKADIDEHGSTSVDDSPEVTARVSASGSVGEDYDFEDRGVAGEKHEYVELYTRLDIDGDGHQELVRIPCIGPTHFVVHDLIEEVSEIPFAWWCPDPEPHTAVGQSWADRLMDLQLIKSSLLRAAHDSAALSVFPRMAYREGRVSVADVQNTEIGAPIRTTDVSDVASITHPFIGDKLLPFLDYADRLAERRTGQNNGAMGLDADALQSSTRGAVSAAVQASQAHIVMLCRLFAEQALKPLFKGLLRLYVERQPRIGSVRINRNWVDVEPAQWDVDFDVTINVALGRITPERIEYMARLVEGMGQVMQLAGPDNPVFSFKEYGEAWRTAVQYMGYENTARFVKPWMGDEAYAQMQQQQAAAQANQPSPEMALVQVEQMKAQADAQAKQQKAQLEQQDAAMKLDIEREKLAIEREKMQMQMAMERQKIEAEIAIKVFETNAKLGTQMSIAEMQAAVGVTQEELRMQSQREAEENRMRHEATMSERQASREDQREGARMGFEREKFERTEDRAERESTRQHEREREKTRTSAETTLAVAEKSAESRKPAAPKKDEKPAKKKRVRLRKDGDSYVAEEED